MSDFFEDCTITITQSDGTVIKSGLPAQFDTVNIPWNAEVQGGIPTDWFDVYSIGWTSPVPARGQYIVNEQTSVKYGVFGLTASYADHLEVRVSKYSGVTP